MIICKKTDDAIAALVLQAPVTTTGKPAYIPMLKCEKFWKSVILKIFSASKKDGIKITMFFSNIYYFIPAWFVLYIFARA